MKAKIKKTGETVEVYHEPNHGQVTNIYKEAVFVNGRMWEEDELDFSVNSKTKEEDLEEESDVDKWVNIVKKHYTMLPELLYPKPFEIILDNVEATARFFYNKAKEQAKSDCKIERQKTIENACEWLDRYFENKVFKTQRETIINDFKEYMEE